MLSADHVEYVSSTSIAKAINVDASQIAKDLSYLNIRGKTRIGYEVAELRQELRFFLGFASRHDAIIVGVGSLGGALIADSGLSRYGLNIVAGYDTNPAVVGKEISGVPVYDVSRLESEGCPQEAEIGIITVPPVVAQECADLLVAVGIRALWNFTPYRIRTAADIVVQNTSIYAHLAVMYNRLEVKNDMQG